MSKKPMVVLVFCSLLFFATTVSAEEDWVCDYEFPATPVVRCVNNGEFEHNIYYFAAGNNKCLVVVCHGFVNNDGYGIFMHNRYRHDYPKAVAESIAYWTRQGKLSRAGDFDYVFMHTCHTGYALASTSLPIYDINLVRAIDYKGINWFSEQPSQNGQVILQFGRVIPRGARATRVPSQLSSFLERNNVRGYKAIGSRSSTKPKGAITLYDGYPEIGGF